MACRVKKFAKSYVEGSFKEQFKRIYDYNHELIRSNPVLATFQRMYVVFQFFKQSFLKCRPIIGLDGCFLKGYYGGQLLAAIRRDPNKQMLPICFAIVEGETKDLWEWFLHLLISDL
uniref:MULE transposase domain-containing protein n=1 Tax=Cajanus cajan TaxID=3821 RepID=A0A151TH57_CAJCA|nr:hypothetical protein KK1_012686 [Cajanus cajan]